MKLVSSISSLTLAIGLSGCGEKPEPIALVVTMKTASGVAKIVTQIQGDIICEKGLNTIPRADAIDGTSEDKLVQLGNDIEKAVSWSISADGRYTLAYSPESTTVLRVINKEGNGTKRIYNNFQLGVYLADICPR